MARTGVRAALFGLTGHIITTRGACAEGGNGAAARLQGGIVNVKAVVIPIVALLICCLAAVVVLSALHDDSTQVVAIITGAIIPTAASLFAVKAATDAKASADQARDNTNGLMAQALATPPPARLVVAPPPAPPAAPGQGSFGPGDTTRSGDTPPA